MVERQTRDRDRLKTLRIVRPGEVDHEVDPYQLVRPGVPTWDIVTLTACAALYDRYVNVQTAGTIPDFAFCDLPRWIFLEYLIRFRDILVVGSNSRNATRLEPVTLSQNLHGWNTPCSYAFSNSMQALFHAVLDRRRLSELDCPIRSMMRWRFADAGDKAPWGFYFGIDYRALSYAPWRAGTVYMYRRAAFPADFEEIPYRTHEPVVPIGSFDVNPWDFPLLDQIHGVDIVAQTERQRETFCGYPWTDDARIHPNPWKRGIIDLTRTYLNHHFSDPVDLSQLGRRVGLSPFALLRMFQAHVGLSPHEYKTQLRIKKAKLLLRSGVPIAEVAMETGFCDQTHLTRQFRRIVGLTPGQYLRMQDSPIRAA